MIHLNKLIRMAVTALATAVLPFGASAQTTLVKLIDSVNVNLRLTAQDNRLFFYTTGTGGTQYEFKAIDTTLQPVGMFSPSSTIVYQSIAFDFIYLNNKVSKVYKGNNIEHLLAADNNTVDTLIKLQSSDYFTDFKKVGNKAFVTTGKYIYVSDFTVAGTKLIDSFNYATRFQVYAGAQHFYYVKALVSNGSKLGVLKTDGTNTVTIDSVEQPNTNKYFELTGEENGVFYYIKSIQAATTTSVEIKKCDAANITASLHTATGQGVVSPVFTDVYASVVHNNMVYALVKTTVSPIVSNLYCYNVAANTFAALTSASPTFALDYQLNKATGSQSYFYFKAYNPAASGGNRYTYITDGTLTGTKLYSKADLKFKDPYAHNFGINRNAILCADYPIAGVTTPASGTTPAETELYIGMEDTMMKYDINPFGSSTPQDFSKIDDTTIYFITYSGTKSSLYRLSGCGLPPTTGIRNTAISSADVSIYPNPSAGTFTISSSRIDGKATVRLLDLTGRAITNCYVQPGSGSLTINAGNIPAGIYVVELLTGTTRTIHKVQIQ